MEGSVVSYYNRPDVRLGFHIAKLPTLFNSFERMIHTPLNSYQIYISNGRAWNPPEINIEDSLKTKSILEKHEKYAVVHGCLLYNLAGSTDHRSDPNFQRKLDNTSTGLLRELDVATSFGAKGVVVHTGCCKDTNKGIFTITKTLETVLSTSSPATKKLSRDLQVPVDELIKSRRVILENAAGEKNKIGSDLEELSVIINAVDSRYRSQIKVCIDTAHIFGAGQYDFGDPDQVETFYEDFDNIIGLNRLEVFHLNDSRVPFGSKKDRHENIGLGHQFGGDLEDGTSRSRGLSRFIDLAEQHHIPLIGEPPATTADKMPGPGGIWDMEVINKLCGLRDDYFVCNR